MHGRVEIRLRIKISIPERNFHSRREISILGLNESDPSGPTYDTSFHEVNASNANMSISVNLLAIVEILQYIMME